MSEQQPNHKSQRWVRLQIKGGTEFNFVLPANPTWKISNLEQHMIKIYNEVTSNQTSQLRAVQVRSLKRNGFYVAPSLKVGDVFNDWDEVTCHIILKTVSDESQQKSIQQEIKKNIQKNKHEHQENKKKETNKKNQQTKQKQQKKSQPKKDNKKKDDSKKEQASSSILSESKLIGMMQKIQSNKKGDEKVEKKAQKKEQDPKEQVKENKKQTKQKTKSGAIIIRGQSDESD